MDENEQKKILYNFIPLLVMILTISFGSPYVVRHFYNTFTNQDYNLNTAKQEEVNDLHEILSLIKPGKTPVVYVEPTRYLNHLSKRRYRDTTTGEIINLNSKIWLPLNLNMLQNVSQVRKTEYINRWLTNHPSDKGWFISALDKSWVYQIEETLNQALTNYAVTQVISYGLLEAKLYEKKY